MADTDDQTIAGKWTRNGLAALSVTERHTVWKNARTNDTPQAKKIVEAIESLGLPYFDNSALTNDDPITLNMRDIIFSSDGRAACLKATEQGLPAIAGVDGMLNEALGIDYQGANMGTQTAGSLVGELMKSFGYKKAGMKAMPPGSVAKTGAFWVPRSPR